MLNKVVGIVNCIRESCWFVSNCWSWILTFKDSFWFVDHESWLKKIWPVFTNPTNPYNIDVLWTGWIHTNPWDLDSQIYMVFKRLVLWIQFGDLFSKDLYRGFDSETCFQKIRIVDLIRRPVFKRFVLWIQFLSQKSQNAQFVLIPRDWCTNPATLKLNQV